MKALIVIDMQEEYVGQKRNQKRYPYDSEQLIKNINSRIAAYEQRTDAVIYIKNKGKSDRVSDLVAEMLLVSDLVYEKSKASCFSDQSLLIYLMDKAINEIELVGVDGNSCIGFSALDGIKHSFSILVSLSCIGIANAERFTATREKLLKTNVTIID